MPLIFTQTAGLSAGVDTTVRTVTASYNGIYEINICKTTAGTAVIKLSVTVGATTTIMEAGVPVIYGGSPLIRTGEVFPPGAAIKVLSDVTGVDVTVSGFEELA